MTQMIGMTTTRVSRAQRMAMPLARDVVRDLAIEHGACIRPIQLRRRNLDTGDIDQVLVPCGHTLASVCPPCAERNKSLRAAQCRVLAATLSAHRSAASGVHVLAALGGDDAGWRQEFRLSCCRDDRR